MNKPKKNKIRNLKKVGSWGLLTILMKSENIGVLIISHNLEHVFRLSDRIAVMKNGKLLSVLDSKKTTREEIVKLITFGTS